MFKKITQRGPNAYEILVDILQSNNFKPALEKLRETNFQSLRNNRNNNNNTNSNDNIPRYPPTPRRPSTSSTNKPRTELNGNQNLELIPEVLDPSEFNDPLFLATSNLRSDSKIGVYPMTKRKRGVLFLVNISKFEFDLEKERRGAHHDTNNLMRLFGNLGFVIFKYEDITKEQFQTLLSKLLDSDYCKQAECFVMALMSHGQMIDRKSAYVTFYNNQREEVHNIMDNFNNKSCSALMRKPKILFFPFCR